ncbi:MAG: metallophosphoesterase family protein [Acidobacteriota bacterium]
MRVAALYDIHGNLPALEAVLRDVRAAGVDRIVVGGDALLGPMPCQTLDCLLALDSPVNFIRGNCDREVLAAVHGTGNEAAPEQVRESIRWVARQLRPTDQRAVAAWPETISLPVDGVGRVLFCHATPENDNDIFTRLTAEEPLLGVFRSVNEAVVVCGHTHMQFDRMVGATRVVNAGSVGMPFGTPRAQWLLAGPDVQLRLTDYDADEAATRIRATEYPEAEDFVTRYVLRQPSEEEMLQVFARREIK